MFGCVVLALYYRQVGRIWEAGPAAWLSDTYSLLGPYNAARNILNGNTALTFPAAFEAARRAGMALLGAGLTLLAGEGLGAAVMRLIRTGRLEWADRWLFQTVLGLGGLAYLFLAMAGLGIYTPDRLRLVVILTAVGTLAWGLFGKLRKGGGPDPRGVVWPSLPSLRGRDAVWAAILVVAGLIALVGALAPEIEYDALWYHLWLPKVWLEHGTAVDLVNEYPSLYPMTLELVFGAGMVLGGPVGAKLLHWICLPLGALLAYRFTQRFFPGASGLFAAAMFVTLPTVLWEATTAYVDLALALACGLTVYALLIYLRKPERHWLILAGLTLGLALAIKHLALLVWVLAIGGLGLLRLRETGSWREAFLSVAPVAIISLIIPLPWYWRSWSASGNPFFPDLYGIFGAFPAERWSALTERGLAGYKAKFGMPRTVWNFLLVPWNATLHTARFGGSLGPVLLLLLPGAALVGRKRREFWLLMLFATGYVALWASPISSFQLRYLVPIAPALAALTAGNFSRMRALFRKGKIPWKGIQAAFAGLLVLNLPPFMSVHEAERVGNEGWLSNVAYSVPLGVVLGLEGQDSYLGRAVPSYRAWQYIDENLPPQARVLTFSGGDHLYSKRDRLWSDSTRAYPAMWGAAPGREEQALDLLKNMGITHILVDRWILAALEPGDLPLLQDERTAKWFNLLYRDERFSLYEIRMMQDVTFDGTD